MRRLFGQTKKVFRNYVTSKELKEAYESGKKFRTFAGSLLTGIGVGYGVLSFYYQKEDEKKIILDSDSAEDLREKQMKDRFELFADVTTSKGKKYLSYQAFVDSIINKDPTKTIKAIPEDLVIMFNLADRNGDRLISFKEYSFFVTLLSCNAREIQSSFMMMDKDGNGNIDMKEFIGILQSQNVDKGFIKELSDLPLIKRFFGEDGKKTLSIDDYIKFIFKLETSLLKFEFNQFDNGSGKIGIEDFINIVHNSVYYNKSLNPNFQSHINTLEKEKNFKYIDYQTYLDFYLMSQHLDDIDLSLEFYNSLGVPITKENFLSAIRKITEIPISDRVVDLVFAMYGTNKELSKETRLLGYSALDKKDE